MSDSLDCQRRAAIRLLLTRRDSLASKIVELILRAVYQDEPDLGAKLLHLCLYRTLPLPWYHYRSSLVYDVNAAWQGEHLPKEVYSDFACLLATEELSLLLQG